MLVAGVCSDDSSDSDLWDAPHLIDDDSDLCVLYDSSACLNASDVDERFALCAHADCTATCVRIRLGRTHVW